MSKWAVIFDCGGVLADDTFPAVYRLLSNQYPPEKAEYVTNTHARNKASWIKLKTDPSFTETHYWEAVIANENYKETPEELGVLLRKSLAHYEHTFKKIATLKEKGITVGVCSNHGTAWFAEISSKFSFGDYFEDELVVVSQTVSAAKPSPKIWAIVDERLSSHHGDSHATSNVIFVDDKDTNVSAAREFGFQAIQFDARKEDGEALMKKLLSIPQFSEYYSKL